MESICKSQGLDPAKNVIFHTKNYCELPRATLEFYTDKTERSAREAFPIIKGVYEDKNNQFERIVVPFTDGIKTLNVVTDLKKAYTFLDTQQWHQRPGHLL